MNFKISLLIASSIVSLLVPKHGIQQQERLTTVPKLAATELDFGRDVITLCMHEGTKLKFKLTLGDYTTTDLKVEVSQGAVDLEVWDQEKNTYLINPKAETFMVDVWVKEAAVQHFKLPTINGEVAAHNEDSAFQTTEAKWKLMTEVFEVRDGYVKVISDAKFYSRTCE